MLAVLLISFVVRGETYQIRDQFSPRECHQIQPLVQRGFDRDPELRASKMKAACVNPEK